MYEAENSSTQGYHKAVTRVSQGYHRVLMFKHRRLLDQGPVKMKQVEHQPVQAHRYRLVHLKLAASKSWKAQYSRLAVTRVYVLFHIVSVVSGFCLVIFVSVRIKLALQYRAKGHA